MICNIISLISPQTSLSFLQSQPPSHFRSFATTSSMSPFSPFPMTIKKIPAASPTFNSRGARIHAALQNLFFFVLAFFFVFCFFVFVFVIPSAVLTLSRWPQLNQTLANQKKVEPTQTSRCNVNGWRFSGTARHIFNLTFENTVNGASESKLLIQWAAESANYFFYLLRYEWKRDKRLALCCVFKYVSIVHKGNVFNWHVVEHWRNCGISHSETRPLKRRHQVVSAAEVKFRIVSFEK